MNALGKITVTAVVLIAMVLSGVVLITQMEEARADRLNSRAQVIEARGHAESQVIRAQSQANITSAQASATLALAFVPYIVALLGLMTVISLFAVVSLFGFYAMRVSRPHMTTNQVFVLPDSPSERKLYYQKLSLKRPPF